MTEYRRSESDDGKFFYLTWSNNTVDFDDGDLGRGSSQQTARFCSVGEREYFIQARIYEDALKIARRRVRYLEAGIRDCLTKTGRVRRKKVIALVATIPAESAPTLRITKIDLRNKTVTLESE